ncbi:MAG: hypothetical protein J6X94_07350 [Lachnospiraceae bacterium]|nr:hypothetical protein [Lachnospiraceae bacterium]
MDATNLNITTTESATEFEHSIPTHKITKEEAQMMTDEKLLQMVQQSQGHTGKDFPEHMSCDFSYTYLTGLLKDRGYEMGWHKTSEGSSPIVKPTVLQMKKSDDEVSRQSYMVEKSVADEWKQFNKNVPYKTVTLGWAMRRFMDDVRSGRIKFELEL